MNTKTYNGYLQILKLYSLIYLCIHKSMNSKYISLLSRDLFSVVLVTCDQPWSETNNPSILNFMLSEQCVKLFTNLLHSAKMWITSSSSALTLYASPPLSHLADIQCRINCGSIMYYIQVILLCLIMVPRCKNAGAGNSHMPKGDTECSL
jgi:hypothetical protein